jgi:flagellin
VDNGGPFTAIAAAAGAPAAPPYTTYTFGSETSVFSGNLAITAGVHAAVTVATAGLTGQQAAAAINANSTLQGYGVRATYDSASHKLAIYGNPDATEAISAAGANGTIYEDPVLTSLSTTSAPVTGVAAHGATVAVTLGSYDDTVSGQLDLTLGSSGLPQDALSLTVAPGTTGQGLVNQINANAAFQTAGVTAAYNEATYTVTLTAPAGLTNTLATTGTALIDTGGPNPLPGTSLAGALSSLTAANAAAVLQTVMSAVASVAYQRGVLGGDANQLTAYSAVVNAEAVNLTAASNAIQATDYSATAADLAKYEVLSQTGVAALAQASGQGRDVLRLLG